MAFLTGSAVGHIDLIEQVRDFAIDPAQGWTTVRDTVSDAITDSELVLESPAGAIVGFRDCQAESGGTFNWRLNGYAEFNNELHFFDQTTGIPTYGYVNAGSTQDFCPVARMTDGAITFWLQVNDRRIHLVYKISNFYFSAYLGYNLAIADPTAFPAPLLIGGNGRYEDDLWSDSGTTAANWPFLRTGVGATKLCRMRDAFGVWLSPYGSTSSYPTDSYIWPVGDNGMEDLGNNIDGTKPIVPLIVISDSLDGVSVDAGSWLGYADGIFVTSHENTTAEQTVVIGGDTYTIFPDIFRNGTTSWFAIKHA